jgi:hypothetical protein
VKGKERELQSKGKEMHVEKSSPTMMRKRDCVLDFRTDCSIPLRLVEEFP